jgi:isopenicillin-N N-acyltransferase-like protein
LLQPPRGPILQAVPDVTLPSIAPLVLDQDTARARGRAHGEHWRDAIAELAALRLSLCATQGVYASAAEVLQMAQRHLPVLAEHLPEQHDELLGIAEGAALGAEQILVLNHYTDLRDAAGVRGEADPGGCTAVYANGDEGPVLGQTWDMHGSALPFVRTLLVAPRGGDSETFVLTLAGCVGMAGMSSTGVAVTINNLRTTDGGVGVAWPSLVRTMLAEPDAAAAKRRLWSVPLSSGHHYMIADGTDFFGVETSGRHKVQTQRGALAAHLHTNHCFDPVLRGCEAVPRYSTTFHRLNLATTVYAQQRPRDAAGIWDLLHTHDDGPGSLCAHEPPDGDPHGAVTCAVMVMRLEDRSVRVVAGCDRRSSPLQIRLGQPRDASSLAETS